jgi:hypothetical protein
MKIVHTGDHTIYGEWSDTGGYQVLVFEHPNGLVCDIFFMDGCDYGGGINHYYLGVSAKLIPSADEATPERDFYHALDAACQAVPHTQHRAYR